jgi:hypothetical protein
MKPIIYADKECSSRQFYFLPTRERGLYRIRALLARQRFFTVFLTVYLYKIYSLLVILSLDCS